MKKLVSGALLALMMLLGAVAADSTPAHAIDDLDDIFDVYDPCADPNAHNWKLCGESSGDPNVFDLGDQRESDLGDKSADEPPPRKGKGEGEGDFGPRHNWKNSVIDGS